MTRRGRDGASVQVLEAVTIATVMIASVAYVVTIDSPPPATGSQRDFLVQKAADTLAIMNDTPLHTELGSNLLAVAIHECLQNDCSRLSTTLEKILPVGTKHAVYLSTKEGLYPVYVPRQPSGEAVTARRSIEPAWSYQFLGLSQSIYNPVADPVVVYGLPVFSGDLVHQGGNGLKITIEGNRTDNGRYVLKSSASTRAVDADDSPTPPATSLYFHAGDGVALATRDVTSISLDLARQPTQVPIPFHVRIHESGGGVVPAGTVVSVEIPHGWSASAQVGANAGNWTWLTNASDKNGTASGSTVSARLNRDVTNGHVDFAFDATYHGDATDYYTFHAHLSAGAYAQAQLLARAHDHATTPEFEVATVTTSVPRPMGVGATTTWTLGALTPQPITVSRIVIEEENGRDIFAGVTPITGSGSWTHEGHRLVWNGGANLGQDSPLALTFRVTSSTSAGIAADRAPFTPSVALGNFTGRLTEETAPGMYRGSFLPADGSYGGYESSTGAGLRATHAAASASVYRTTALPGSIEYEVGYVLGLRDSGAGSSVGPATRTTEPGGSAQIDVEMQSVLYELAALGFTPSIDVHVYPPWGGASKEPLVSYEVFNGTLAAGGGPFSGLLDIDGDLVPDATDIGRHQLSVPIPDHWLYGPYVVEARVSWLETLTGILDGIPLTQDLIRTTSVYDYFTVRPTGEPLPASPIYDVHLVTWFEDWS